MYMNNSMMNRTVLIWIMYCTQLCVHIAVSGFVTELAS